jgi:hypothetical protein
MTVATVVARNTSEVVPMEGSGGVCVWRESGVGFVLLYFVGNMKIFTD